MNENDVEKHQVWQKEIFQSQKIAGNLWYEYLTKMNAFIS